VTAAPTARPAGAGPAEESRPASLLHRALALVPLLFAVPVLAGIAVSLSRLVVNPAPDADFLSTLNNDAEALHRGEPLYRDPNTGYTGMIYTPFLPAVVSLLFNVALWTGWAILLGILSSLALLALVAWMAYRPPGPARGDRALALVEAVGVGALGWIVASCVRINGLYTGRIDQPAWALGLLGLALVPAAVGRSRRAPFAGVAAVVLLSAAFWTRQNAVVAPLAAVAWAVLAARSGAGSRKAALALAVGLAAVNLLVLLGLNLLTGGWEWEFNFAVPSAHSLGDLGPAGPANVVRYGAEVVGVTALGLVLWGLLAAAAGRRRLRTLGARAGRSFSAASRPARVAAALVALGAAGALLVGGPYLLTVAAGRPLVAGLDVVVVGCALLSLAGTGGLALGVRALTSGRTSTLLRGRAAAGGTAGLAVGALAYLRLSTLPIAPGSLWWLLLRVGAALGLALLIGFLVVRAGAARGNDEAAAGRGPGSGGRASTRERVAGVMVTFLVLDVLATLYMRQKLGGDDHYYVGMAWALALLVAASYRRAGAAGRPSALAAAAVVGLAFVLVLLVSPRGGPPNALAVPSLAPVRDAEVLDRTGYALYGSAPGLYPETEWGRVSPELRTFAARHPIYDPASGDPLLDTRGALYPGFDDWYGMVAAGLRPGHLIRALTERRFDAVAPFDEGKWSEEFASGRGRFEANFVQKLNRVIEAKYARSGAVPEGFLARRPGPDPAPWMAGCFGPFDLAGSSWRINRGGGFWCREGQSLTLRETGAAFSDVRTTGAARVARGRLSVALPRPGTASVALEPGEGSPMRVILRTGPGGGEVLAFRGARELGRWRVSGERGSAARLELEFAGNLGSGPVTVRAGGRRLGVLPTDGLDEATVLRVGASARSGARIELGALDLE